jgi:murein DD-endopeptidase MepM/ murein hydrolase activator NlpD
VSVSSRSVKAKVPNRAVTGHPKVVDAYDNQAGSPSELEIVPPDQIPTDAGFKLKDANASPSNTFFDGSEPARVEYVFGGGAPTDIRIAVVNRDRGEVVDSWVQEAQTPYEVHSARWRGTRRAPNGRYRFRIGPVSGSLESTAAAEFEYHRDKFPVRGPHSYGDGYGAPRSDHVHMGQDVMAACGTPLQAARGGTVQWKAYQASGGGYYVVIDGKGTDHDFVYMHLAQPARVHEGDRVHTGQRIGIVGDTGDASGCHLHFEIWNGDWWNGGEAMASVTRQMRRWDSWS